MKNGVKSIKKIDGEYLIKFFEDKVEIDRVSMLISEGKAKYIQSEKAIAVKQNLEKFLTEL